MNKLNYFLLFIFFFYGCENFGQLKVIDALPKVLEEVSGIETTEKSKYYWMLNDSGNKPRIYAISKKGNIKREVKITSKNHDWEDITSDDEGNLYIGDFGNNANNRKNLRILKVKKKYLNDKEGKTSKIEFSYEDQSEYPPNNEHRFFDAEAFFYHNKFFYIFTKSRVHDKYGVTTLYKIPAKKGKHKAKKIGTFNNGSEMENWITSADISPDEKTIALLTHKSVLLFSNFTNDNFFNGNLNVLEFNHVSQKESVAFKDDNTLLISDEKSHGKKGYLYEFSIK